MRAWFKIPVLLIGNSLSVVENLTSSDIRLSGKKIITKANMLCRAKGVYLIFNGLHLSSQINTNE